MFFDAVDFDADIRLADTQHGGHLFIAETFEKQQGDRPVNLIELVYFPVKPAQSFIYGCPAFLQEMLYVIECFGAGIFFFFGGSFEGSCMCEPVQPGCNGSVLPECGNGMPYLDDAFLETIVVICYCICPADLNNEPSVHF